MNAAGKTPAELLDDLNSAGWPELADHLLWGMCHSLNGRISSLLSLAYLAEQKGFGDKTFLETLEGEADRFTEIVRLMESIPDDGFREPEPVSLSETLKRLLELAGRQKGLETTGYRTVEVGQPPSVLMTRTLLHRGLMLLITAVAQSARTSGAEEVEVTLAEADGGAEVTIRPLLPKGGIQGSLPGEAPASSADQEGPGTDLHLESRMNLVGEVFASAGGTVRWEWLGGEKASVTVWLPSLAQARAES